MYKNSFVECGENSLVFLKSENLSARHAFTTRLGGVSEGHLASLNLGENRGDVPERVIENYRRLTAATGIETSVMAFTNQVHGNVVKTVTKADARRHFEPMVYECDGLVTSERGLTIACFTADCVPVLLCDDAAGVIAAVHCGWRSSVSDILKNAVCQMLSLGANKARICAAIGPAIGYCCFEVGAEVIRACEAYIGDCSEIVTPKENGKYLLDLKAANATRLCQLGVPKENISISPDCTMCRNDKYFSHRFTKGLRGTQGSLITL